MLINTKGNNKKHKCCHFYWKNIKLFLHTFNPIICFGSNVWVSSVVLLHWYSLWIDHRGHKYPWVL